MGLGKETRNMEWKHMQVAIITWVNFKGANLEGVELKGVDSERKGSLNVLGSKELTPPKAPPTRVEPKKKLMRFWNSWRL